MKFIYPNANSAMITQTVRNIKNSLKVNLAPKVTCKINLEYAEMGKCFQMAHIYVFEGEL